MHCSNCGSKDIESDNTRGDTVCRNCGKVLEENLVVNEVSFENTKVLGTFISDQMGGASFSKNRHGNPILDSSAIRINKAYKEIQQIASKLSIHQYLIDMAKRIFNLASNKKFIQGRKTRHVVAVILYTVCRMQKTRHLLIDFSDALQTNLYVLGSIYLKLIRLLQISVPLIDPSLFIHRFCAKLEFGEKTKIVSNTSLRILQSMSRDWMTVGRRPSGLCGAAILISARYHNFKRTTQQIVEVVNVCDETIRKRLEEFSKTPVAKLTKLEFESIRFTDEIGMDPPSYIKNRSKDKKITDKLQISQKVKEIEKMFDEELSENRKKEEPQENLLSENLINYQEQKIEYKENLIEIEEPLSDINDDEISYYILSNEEYKLKKMLWEVLFKDWIEDQKAREPKKKLIAKKRSRKVSKADNIIPKTPVEAIIKNSDKLKNKNLNYKLLESLFQK